jgi:pimeloyl-ACP methyl ester carboxylesterase
MLGRKLRFCRLGVVRRPSISRTRLALSLAGGTAAAAGAVVVQRRHLAAIAADPLNARLLAPVIGTSLSARSVDGTNLHVEVFGEGSADGDLPTFVLAHGWTEQLSYWTLVVERLTAAGFRVAAYDLRGHGMSDPGVDGDYSVQRFGEDLEAVLAAVCAEREPAIVAGHSLGGMSIVGWAADHDVQTRAVGAALLFTGVWSLLAESTLIPVPLIAGALSHTPIPAAMLTAPGPVPKISTPLSAAIVKHIAFGPTATPAMVAFYERMLIACPPDVRTGVALRLVDLDLQAALPRLTVPTLVMAGAQDRLTPPVHAERMAAALPSLESLVVLEKTGHMGPLERPDEVSDALVKLAAAAHPAAAERQLA